MAVILSGFAFAEGEGDTKVTEDSKVSWKGEKVTGEHWGYVSVKDAKVEVRNGMMTGGSFSIDMNSITVEDLEAGSEYNTKLVGHLKSDDFFGVKQYPTSDFKITRVVPMEGSKYRVTGELTIKGITQTISFPATIKVDGDMVHTKATFKIDRSKFNVKYGSETFYGDLKDKAIYDEFEMTLNLHMSIYRVGLG